MSGDAPSLLRITARHATMSSSPGEPDADIALDGLAVRTVDVGSVIGDRKKAHVSRQGRHHAGPTSSEVALNDTGRMTSLHCVGSVASKPCQRLTSSGTGKLVTNTLDVLDQSPNWPRYAPVNGTGCRQASSRVGWETSDDT